MGGGSSSSRRERSPKIRDAGVANVQQNRQGRRKLKLNLESRRALTTDKARAGGRGAKVQ